MNIKINLKYSIYLFQKLFIYFTQAFLLNIYIRLRYFYHKFMIFYTFFYFIVYFLYIKMHQRRSSGDGGTLPNLNNFIEGTTSPMFPQ